jgi:uncharacterized protein YdeI (YjbR/CyaY-like superfamily)
MTHSLETLDVATPEAWRRWLAAHHDRADHIWLVFHKRATGGPSISYNDAVDEALCYGWIDSLIRRLDEARYARKFTPRQPDSKWSSANRKRYADLLAAGRLTSAGLDRPPTSRSGDAPPSSPRGELPRYIRVELKRHPVAWAYFERLAPSHRRMYVGWIDSAKREDTKRRRLREAVRLLTAGRKLGLK